MESPGCRKRAAVRTTRCFHRRSRRHRRSSSSRGGAIERIDADQNSHLRRAHDHAAAAGGRAGDRIAERLFVDRTVDVADPLHPQHGPVGRGQSHQVELAVALRDGVEPAVESERRPQEKVPMQRLLRDFVPGLLCLGRVDRAVRIAIEFLELLGVPRNSAWVTRPSSLASIR